MQTNSVSVRKRDDRQEEFDDRKIRRVLDHVAKDDLSEADKEAIVAQCKAEVYDGITTKEIENMLIMVTRSFIERDPIYSKVAARLLMYVIYREVIGEGIDYSRLETQHRQAFIDSIRGGVESGVLDERMLEFDLDRLSKHIDISLDNEFKYIGIQTLFDNYLRRCIKSKKILETPQIFWMRIAMGSALNEQGKDDWAEKFYEIMAKMIYTPSTPTLFHAGFKRAQLSSCYLNSVQDSLENIFKTYGDNAQLSKYTGGIGTDWTNVRATGSTIKGTGVESQGVIPFLKIANDATAAINRSGKRRGAAAVYLETWHLDIESFLELRKNTGDERRRTHDINTANWIPDLFMERVRDGGTWTLFSPSDVPELHDLYGDAFKEKYEEYEAKRETIQHKVVKASDLWRKMMMMLFETGHPWITFKDACNLRNPQDHVGVIHNSNLCTEITLNTSEDETAVCNLGSLNFAKFVNNGRWDSDLVKEVVPIAIRMLDNVIDINFYPTEDAKRSNMRHRPIGLGVRGYQDALYKLDIPFDSERNVEFASSSMEDIAMRAIMASSQLAKERGSYETYEGSKWSRGILPQDTVSEAPEDGMWEDVRNHIREYGMRNSNVMAVAPTATTANIVGCYPSIEPIYNNIYVKSNRAGDFVVVNEYLVSDLKRLGLWDDQMVGKLKYVDGNLNRIDEIPQDIKDKYKTVWDIPMDWLLRAASARGRWIDQSQSLNIFFRGTSGKELSEIYFKAWELGLKTTYYLRTLAASQVEKSTVGETGSHKREITIHKAQAEDCESCQA